MVEIKPFQGLRYSESVVVDPGRVICPPYDVISPDEQRELLGRSIYNAINLELPVATEENQYGQAQKKLKQWLEEGVLQADEEPALYLVAHTFLHRGKRVTRTELTARVRLEDFSSGIIKPHEHTEEGPIEKRIGLLRTCQINVSPVMGLYEDPYGTIPRLLARVQLQPAGLSFTVPGEESYDVWMIMGEEDIDSICSAFAPLSLYIADGHHRYAAALRYRDGSRAALGSPTANEPYEFIMMSLTDLKDQGLLALPYHRALRGLPPGSVSGLKKGLEGFFKLETAPLEQRMVEPLFEPAASSRREQVLMAVVGLEEGKLVSLKPKAKDVLDRLMAVEYSEVWRSLPPSIFREGILRSLLGLEEEEAIAAGQLTFVKDAAEAVALVSRGECQLAFLLRPVPLTGLKRVADNGELLPPKSTYFYPKLPTGLVFYNLA